MTREQARIELLNREPDFLPVAKGKANGHLTYVCPECQNGTGKDGDGIALNVNSKSEFPHWKCHKCGLNGDLLELWMKHIGITDYAEAFRTAYEHYDIIIDSSTETRSKSTQPRQPVKGETTIQKQERATNAFDGLSVVSAQNHQETAPQQDYSQFFLWANQNLTMTDYHRGIRLETLNRFRVGFIPDWQSPKALRDGKKPPKTPRLIIPTSPYSYIARDTRPEAPKKFSKLKEGAVHVFNIGALQTSEKPVFVVEGELDALSIIDVGGEAIALGSTSNIEKLFEALKEYKTQQPLIISLDNDKAGKEATDKLIQGLKERGVTSYLFDIAEPYKDANEALNADRDSFKEIVQAVQDDPETAVKELIEAEYMKTSALFHLQEFQDGIKASANTEYIPTGFTALDSVLDGGLYEGLYFVGAISSLGKTTFVLQISDQIAQHGNDVLIFSLEMARNELIAKSISRLTLLDVLAHDGNTRHAKTARGITTGSRYEYYSAEEKELIQRAINVYSRYAGNIFIHEGIGDIGVDKIRQTIEKHISITGRKPVVIIDYVQILAPKDVRATDKKNTDMAVLELKRISRDFKIPVIGISSFNRENYKSSVNYASFKESGAIEYSADVLIGLQLHNAGKSDFDENKEKNKNPRNIELVILKNRNGATGKKIQYAYYSMFNYYKEIGKIKETN